MRLSVLDVGSNTVPLEVSDAKAGVPLPVPTAKWKLRLSERVRDDGRLEEADTEQLLTALSAAAETAGLWDAPEPWCSPPPWCATRPTGRTSCGRCTTGPG